jgi:C_GCAxxG_C_C family probable redox protein
MKGDEAAKTYQSGFNCAQSVFIPFAVESGISEKEASRIASAFGAGMARMQETCGAVTGGLMAMGLAFGFEKADDQAQKDVVLGRAKEFLAKCKVELGTLSCKELLGCDLNTAEGQAFHKAQNQRELICLNCVRKAAAIVEAMN